MATGIMTDRTGVAPLASTPFERFAGVCSIVAGLVSLLYAIAFFVLNNAFLSALFLMLSGLLTSTVLVVLYNRLHHIDRSLALWALLLSITGALGATIHGGYDLATAINPPASDPLGAAGLPHSVDPRGLLTFGLAGIGISGIAWLIGRSEQFSKSLALLGYILATMLIVLYLSRLIVVDATNLAVVVPALLTGFILNPLWYLWLGLLIRRG